MTFLTSKCDLSWPRTGKQVMVASLFMLYKGSQQELLKCFLRPCLHLCGSHLALGQNFCTAASPKAVRPERSPMPCWLLVRSCESIASVS